MLSPYLRKTIVMHINNNYSRNKTYVELYRELATKYNVSADYIKGIYYRSTENTKLKSYHAKMDKIIAIKIKSNPFNLEKCFRELSCEHNETFKYFKNRYYRHVKFNEKLFYIENNGIKLYNVKQITN